MRKNKGPKITLRGAKAIRTAVETGCPLYAFNPQRGWVPVITMRPALAFLAEDLPACVSYGVEG